MMVSSSDGGLAGLAVADDELALAAADRNHGVDGLEAGGHGLAHALTVNDSGGEALDREADGGGDRALVVDGLAERVDHAADHGVANRHAENLAGALDFVAFAELGVVAQNDGADLVLFKREREARDAVREAEQLAGHDLVESVKARDAVAEGGDGADFVDLHLRVVVRDLFAKKLRNLVCLDLSHLKFLALPAPGGPDVFAVPAEKSSKICLHPTTKTCRSYPAINASFNRSQPSAN